MDYVLPKKAANLKIKNLVFGIKEMLVELTPNTTLTMDESGNIWYESSNSIVCIFHHSIRSIEYDKPIKSSDK